MSKIGTRLLSAVVATGSISEFIKLPLGDHLFYGSEVPLYQCIKNHIKKHGKVPSVTTIEEALGDVLEDTDEPAKFYLEEVNKRYLHTELKAMVMQASEHLKGEDPDKAFTLMLGKIADLHQVSMGKNIIDFRDIADIVLGEMSKQQHGDEPFIKFGWPSLDNMSGGMRPGDFVSIVGRPQCLSGDTQIKVSRGKSTSVKAYSIKDLFRRFHKDAAMLTRVKSVKDDNILGLNLVTGVVYSGVKKTYTVTTSKGNALRATMQHKFLTPHGYVALSALKVGDVVMCEQKESQEVPGRKSHTVVGIAITGIDYYGEEDTYDICCNYPYNNFVAHDFVVHNSGKTFLTLYSSLHGWTSGQRPLFISMEMTKLLIAQRLAAIHSHTKLTHILTAGVTSEPFKMMSKILKGAKKKENPMWIVDGNMTATPQDIIMLCQQMNPTAVYVDGAYLLRNTNNRLSKWDRMGENAEELKKVIATDLGIPVVASYQFSKESSKAKKKNKEGAAPGLEDIYGSDAIAQLSTVCLGLFEEEGVAQLNQRKVNILKGRNGEKGSFSIKWDFGHAMDFSEVIPLPHEKLQFLG